MSQQQLQDIKLDQLTAADAFQALGRQKLSSFETVSELATALKPYLMLTSATASEEPKLRAEIESLKAQLEEKK